MNPSESYSLKTPDGLFLDLSTPVTISLTDTVVPVLTEVVIDPGNDNNNMLIAKFNKNIFKIQSATWSMFTGTIWWTDYNAVSFWVDSFQPNELFITFNQSFSSWDTLAIAAWVVENMAWVDYAWTGSVVIKAWMFNSPPEIIHNSATGFSWWSDFTIDANVVDFDWSIANAKLYYREYGKTNLSTKPMVTSWWSGYTATVPAFTYSNANWIQYYIEATDDTGWSSYFPAAAFGSGWSFTPSWITIFTAWSTITMPLEVTNITPFNWEENVDPSQNIYIYYNQDIVLWNGTITLTQQWGGSVWYSNFYVSNGVNSFIQIIPNLPLTIGNTFNVIVGSWAYVTTSWSWMSSNYNFSFTTNSTSSDVTLPTIDTIMLDPYMPNELMVKFSEPVDGMTVTNSWFKIWGVSAQSSWLDYGGWAWNEADTARVRFSTAVTITAGSTLVNVTWIKDLVWNTMSWVYYTIAEWSFEPPHVSAAILDTSSSWLTIRFSTTMKNALSATWSPFVETDWWTKIYSKYYNDCSVWTWCISSIWSWASFAWSSSNAWSTDYDILTVTLASWYTVKDGDFLEVNYDTVTDVNGNTIQWWAKVDWFAPTVLTMTSSWTYAFIYFSEMVKEIEAVKKNNYLVKNSNWTVRNVTKAQMWDRWMNEPMQSYWHWEMFTDVVRLTIENSDFNNVTVINIVDEAGNSIDTSNNNNYTSVATLPTITNVAVYDDNSNGFIDKDDRVLVEFSAAMTWVTDWWSDIQPYDVNLEWSNYEWWYWWDGASIAWTWVTYTWIVVTAWDHPNIKNWMKVKPYSMISAANIHLDLSTDVTISLTDNLAPVLQMIEIDPEISWNNQLILKFNKPLVFGSWVTNWSFTWTISSTAYTPNSYWIDFMHPNELILLFDTPLTATDTLDIASWAIRNVSWVAYTWLTTGTITAWQFNNLPWVIHTAPTTFSWWSDFNLTSTITEFDGTWVTAKLAYREYNTTQVKFLTLWMSWSFVSTGTAFTWKVAAFTFENSDGIEYYFQATDNAGGTTYYPPANPNPDWTFSPNWITIFTAWSTAEFPVNVTKAEPFNGENNVKPESRVFVYFNQNVLKWTWSVTLTQSWTNINYDSFIVNDWFNTFVQINPQSNLVKWSTYTLTVWTWSYKAETWSAALNSPYNVSFTVSSASDDFTVPSVQKVALDPFMQNEIFIKFSEPIDSSTVVPANFILSWSSAMEAWVEFMWGFNNSFESSDKVRVRFSSTNTITAWVTTVTITGVTDIAWNSMSWWAYSIEAETFEQPWIESAILDTASGTLKLAFTSVMLLESTDAEPFNLITDWWTKLKSAYFQGCDYSLNPGWCTHSIGTNATWAWSSSKSSTATGDYDIYTITLWTDHTIVDGDFLELWFLDWNFETNSNVDNRIQDANWNYVEMWAKIDGAKPWVVSVTRSWNYAFVTFTEMVKETEASKTSNYLVKQSWGWTVRVLSATLWDEWRNMPMSDSIMGWWEWFEIFSKIVRLELVTGEITKVIVSNVVDEAGNAIDSASNSAVLSVPPSITSVSASSQVAWATQLSEWDTITVVFSENIATADDWGGTVQPWHFTFKMESPNGFVPFHCYVNWDQSQWLTTNAQTDPECKSYEWWWPGENAQLTLYSDTWGTEQIWVTSTSFRSAKLTIGKYTNLREWMFLEVHELKSLANSTKISFDNSSTTDLFKRTLAFGTPQISAVTYTATWTTWVASWDTLQVRFSVVMDTEATFTWMTLSSDHSFGSGASSSWSTDKKTITVTFDWTWVSAADGDTLTLSSAIFKWKDGTEISNTTWVLDFSSPTISNVYIKESPTDKVIVQFSENVTKNSAQSSSNYYFTGWSVQSARLLEDNKSVMLKMSWSVTTWDVVWATWVVDSAWNAVMNSWAATVPVQPTISSVAVDISQWNDKWWFDQWDTITITFSDAIDSSSIDTFNLNESIRLKRRNTWWSGSNDFFEEHGYLWDWVTYSLNVAQTIMTITLWQWPWVWDGLYVYPERIRAQNGIPISFNDGNSTDKNNRKISIVYPEITTIKYVDVNSSTTVDEGDTFTIDFNTAMNTGVSISSLADANARLFPATNGWIMENEFIASWTWVNHTWWNGWSGAIEWTGATSLIITLWTWTTVRDGDFLVLGYNDATRQKILSSWGIPVNWWPQIDMYAPIVNMTTMSNKIILNFTEPVFNCDWSAIQSASTFWSNQWFNDSCSAPITFTGAALSSTWAWVVFASWFTVQNVRYDMSWHKMTLSGTITNGDSITGITLKDRWGNSITTDGSTFSELVATIDVSAPSLIWIWVMGTITPWQVKTAVEQHNQVRLSFDKPMNTMSMQCYYEDQSGDWTKKCTDANDNTLNLDTALTLTWWAGLTWWNEYDIWWEPDGKTVSIIPTSNTVNIPTWTVITVSWWIIVWLNTVWASGTWLIDFSAIELESVTYSWSTTAPQTWDKFTLQFSWPVDPNSVNLWGVQDALIPKTTINNLDWFVRVDHNFEANQEDWYDWSVFKTWWDSTAVLTWAANARDQLIITLGSSFNLWDFDLIRPEGIRWLNGQFVNNNLTIDTSKPYAKQAFYDVSESKVYLMLSEELNNSLSVSTWSLVIANGSFSVDTTVAFGSWGNYKTLEISLGGWSTINAWTTTIALSWAVYDKSWNTWSWATATVRAWAKIEPATNVVLSDNDTTTWWITKDDITIIWSWSSTTGALYDVFLMPDFSPFDPEKFPPLAINVTGTGWTWASETLTGTAQEVIYSIFPNDKQVAYVVAHSGTTAFTWQDLDGVYSPPTVSSAVYLTAESAADTFPPFVIESNPLPWMQWVSSNISKMIVVFNEAMSGTSITSASVYLTGDVFNNNAWTVTWTPELSYDTNKNAVILDMSWVTLQDWKDYQIKVGSGVMDSEWNRMAMNVFQAENVWSGTFAWADFFVPFRTATAQDTTNPTVLWHSLATTTSVDPALPFVSIKFSEDMLSEWFSNSNISISPSLSNTTVRYSIPERSVYIEFGSILTESTSYTLTMLSQSAVDLAWNKLAADYTLNFTTTSLNTTAPKANFVWAEEWGGRVFIWFDQSMKESTVEALSNFVIKNSAWTQQDISAWSITYDTNVNEVIIEKLSLTPWSYTLELNRKIQWTNGVNINASDISAYESSTWAMAFNVFQKFSESASASDIISAVTAWASWSSNFFGSGSSSIGADGTVLLETADWGKLEATFGQNAATDVGMMNFTPITAWPFDMRSWIETSYHIWFPLNKSIDAWWKIKLQFPSSFVLTNAAIAKVNGELSWANQDINWPWEWTILLDTISVDKITNTLTITITWANTQPFGYLDFEISGIKNGDPSQVTFDNDGTPSWGHVVKIWTQSSTNSRLQWSKSNPIESLRFPIDESWAWSISWQVLDTAWNALNGIKVHLWGNWVDEVTTTSTNGDDGTFTFISLPVWIDEYDWQSNYGLSVEIPDGKDYVLTSTWWYKDLLLYSGATTITWALFYLNSAANTITFKADWISTWATKRVTVWAFSKDTSTYIERDTTLGVLTATWYTDIKLTAWEWEMWMFQSAWRWPAWESIRVQWADQLFLEPQPTKVEVSWDKTVTFSVSQAESTIQWIVKDGDSIWLSNVKLWFKSSDKNLKWGKWLTNIDGTFTLNVKPWIYEIWITIPWIEAVEPVQVSAEDWSLTWVTFIVDKPSLSVAWVIQDANGNPVKWAQLKVKDTTYNKLIKIKPTSTDGKYSFLANSGTTYEVVATHKNPQFKFDTLTIVVWETNISTWNITWLSTLNKISWTVTIWWIAQPWVNVWAVPVTSTWAPRSDIDVPNAVSSDTNGNYVLYVPASNYNVFAQDATLGQLPSTSADASSTSLTWVNFTVANKYTMSLNFSVPSWKTVESALINITSTDGNTKKTVSIANKNSTTIELASGSYFATAQVDKVWTFDFSTAVKTSDSSVSKKSTLDNSIELSTWVTVAFDLTTAMNSSNMITIAWNVWSKTSWEPETSNSTISSLTSHGDVMISILSINGSDQYFTNTNASWAYSIQVKTPSSWDKYKVVAKKSWYTSPEPYYIVSGESWEKTINFALLKNSSVIYAQVSNASGTVLTKWLTLWAKEKAAESIIPWNFVSWNTGWILSFAVKDSLTKYQITVKDAAWNSATGAFTRASDVTITTPQTITLAAPTWAKAELLNGLVTDATPSTLDAQKWSVIDNTDTTWVWLSIPAWAFWTDWDVSVTINETAAAPETEYAKPFGWIWKELKAEKSSSSSDSTENLTEFSPIEMTLVYTKDDIDKMIAAGSSTIGDVKKLNNAYWNTTSESWEPMTTTKTVQVKQNSWSTFATIDYDQYASNVNATTANSDNSNATWASYYYDYKITLVSSVNHFTLFSTLVSSVVTTAEVETWVPDAPVNVSASAVWTGQIDFSWDYDWVLTGTNNPTWYKVYRGTTLVATYSTAATLSHSFTGLNASTTYTYKVLAYNWTWDGDPVQASATTLAEVTITETSSWVIEDIASISWTIQATIEAAIDWALWSNQAITVTWSDALTVVKNRVDASSVQLPLIRDTATQMKSMSTAFSGISTSLSSISWLDTDDSVVMAKWTISTFQTWTSINTWSVTFSWVADATKNQFFTDAQSTAINVETRVLMPLNTDDTSWTATDKSKASDAKQVAIVIPKLTLVKDSTDGNLLDIDISPPVTLGVSQRNLLDNQITTFLTWSSKEFAIHAALQIPVSIGWATWWINFKTLSWTTQVSQYVDICMSWSTTSYGTWVAWVKVYYSSWQNWKEDASATGFSFPTSSQFCFQTDHFSDFAVGSESCESGTHYEWESCVSDNWTWAITNWTWTSTWSGAAWTSTAAVLCELDYYVSGSSCAVVWNGYYSPINDGARYQCSNKPTYSAYSSDWDGANSCGFTCTSGYEGVSCTAIQSSTPSWGWGWWGGSVTPACTKNFLVCSNWIYQMKSGLSCRWWYLWQACSAEEDVELKKKLLTPDLKMLIDISNEWRKVWVVEITKSVVFKTKAFNKVASKLSDKFAKDDTDFSALAWLDDTLVTAESNYKVWYSKLLVALQKLEAAKSSKDSKSLKLAKVEWKAALKQLTKALASKKKALKKYGSVEMVSVWGIKVMKLKVKFTKKAYERIQNKLDKKLDKALAKNPSKAALIIEKRNTLMMIIKQLVDAKKMGDKNKLRKLVKAWKNTLKELTMASDPTYALKKYGSVKKLRINGQDIYRVNIQDKSLKKVQQTLDKKVDKVITDKWSKAWDVMEKRNNLLIILKKLMDAKKAKDKKKLKELKIEWLQKLKDFQQSISLR